MVIQGIIRPPPDIRAVVDKTAQFVSKNGRAFESRILNSDKGKTTKFAFLHDTSPFHAYYEDRIRFYEEGGEEKEDEKKEEGTEEKEVNGDRAEKKDERKKSEKERGTVASAARKRIQKPSVDPIARVLLAERSILQQAVQQRPPLAEAGDDDDNDNEGKQEQAKNNEDNGTEKANKLNALSILQTLSPPSQPFVSMAAPSNVTSLELDVMRFTAQFVALTRAAAAAASSTQSNKSLGTASSFLDELALKEWSNPLFQFLQPRHAHFAYFTALVDGYRKLLYLAVMEREKAREKGEYFQGKNAASSAMLKKNELEEIERGRKEMKELLLPISSSTRDASVEHSSGADYVDLSGCLRVAARRAEYGRFKAELEEKKRLEAEGGEEGLAFGSAYVDWHDFVVVETIEFPVDEIVEAPPPPPAPKKKKVESKPRHSVADNEKQVNEEESEGEDMDMDMETDEEDEENIEIVSNYKPKVISHTSTTQDLTRTHMIDPITGKSVALADMSEHMRIQLLDPKWAEEKKKFQEKQRESNFVQGTDIAANISRLAKHRGDIFGSSREELLHQEEDSKKRLEEANRIIREQASLPQPQPQPQPKPVGAAAGSKRPGATGPSVPTPAAPPAREASSTSPSAKRPRVAGAHTGQSPPVPPPPSQASSTKIAASSPVAQTAPASLQPPPTSHARPPVHLAPPPPPPPVSTAASLPPHSLPTNAAPASAPVAAPQMPPPPSVSSVPVSAPVPAPAPPVVGPLPPLKNPEIISLSIQIPLANAEDTTFQQWQFHGQIICLQISGKESSTTTIRSIKDRLRPSLGNMPLNKMQLKSERIGFLKDAMKLADFVAGGGGEEKLDLVPKVRGGRK